MSSAAPSGPPAAAPGPAAPSFRRVLANGPFARLWSSQLISQSGDFVFEVALLWLVLETTHSALDVGIVVAGTLLPRVLVGPFLGVYIDRWDRRRTLVATNVAEGLVVAVLSGLVVTGRVDLPGLFGLVLVLGTGSTIVGIASTAYTPAVVPAGDLGAANGLLSIGSSANQVAGLAVGGVVVALLGPAIPIEFDALTFFAAAALLAFGVRTAASVPVAPSPATPAGFLAELTEGVAYIRGQRFLLELIVVGMMVNFFGNGIGAVLAPYAAYVLHGTAATYGFLGAAVAVGSIAGALVVGRMNTRRTSGRILFLGGLLTGGAILGLGLATSLAPAFALALGLGVLLAVVNLPLQVLIQAKVPHRLMGRVVAVFTSLVLGTAPLGPLFAGWLAEAWSVAAVFLVSGAAIVVAFALGTVGLKALRTVEY